MKDLEIFDKKGKSLDLYKHVVMLLPSAKEMELKTEELKINMFEDDEKVEKREFELGFRRCYHWIKQEKVLKYSKKKWKKKLIK